MPMMPLDHAASALEDFVERFRNDMVRAKTTEMTAYEWAEAFQRWLSPFEFEQHYEWTREFLAELDRR